MLDTYLAKTLATYGAAPPARGRARILDATAGEGNVLRALGQAWAAETYGVEPTDAATAARYGTTKVLRDRFLDIRASSGCMSAVVGAIPSEITERRQRDHAAYVQKALDLVAPGGLLALTGPREAFDLGVCTTLVRRAQVQAFRATPGEGGEVLVVGVRLPARRSGAHPGGLMKQIDDGALAAFAPAEQPLTTLPALAGQFTFGPSTMVFADVVDEAARYGVWTQRAYERWLLRAPERSLRPVMPLRKGHLALLVAGGLFDNLVLSRGRERLVVKGRTLKIRQSAEQEGARMREAERFRIQVSVLDLRTGDLHVLHDA